MLGELNELQIDHLLLSQFVGRIGCTNNKNPYIVPVTYVYDGKYIIGQTKEGLKHVANIGVHGKSVPLHLETSWSKNITITTRLVDTVTTPMLMKTVSS